MKKFNKKGFTLAELLIVVAIIAVLAAISIPIFTAQLNKPRVAADEANIRNGYAVVSAQILTEKVEADTTYLLNKDGTVAKKDDKTTVGTFTTQGNTTEAVTVGGNTDLTWTSGKTVSYEYKKDTQNVTINIAK